MKLIIDQGNTQIKLAIFNDKKLIDKRAFNKNETSNIKNYIQDKGIKSSILSTVTTDIFELNLKNHITLNYKTPLPIINDYESPETLGLDRLANAVAINYLNPNAASLAIDLGTCIKYDLVNDEGKYLGGNISPGLKMRYKSLEAFTDQLPLIETQKFEFDLGKNTTTSILNGVEQGIYHEINGFIERYSNQFKGLTIFMTGGTTNFFDKEYKSDIFANPNLTLIGLNEILDYNAE